MKISVALDSINRLAIETAPFIYFVERNPIYVERIRVVFHMIRERKFTGVTSVVTLTEVLNKPIQRGDKATENIYRNMLLRGRNLTLIPITALVAEHAAQLRATYNLKTPDALQVAAAIDTSCDGFLTNDRGLKRIKEIRVIVLDELEID